MLDEELVQALFWIGIALWGIGDRLVRAARQTGKDSRVPLLRRDFK